MRDSSLTSGDSTPTDPTIVPEPSPEYVRQAMSAVTADTLPLPQSVPTLANSHTLALPSRPWFLPTWQAQFFLMALASTAVVLFLRLFQLDQLQAEMYGDIVTVYEYADSIRQGFWPTSYALAVGPLYPYAITPLLKLVGLSYFGLKLSAAATSLGVVAATYALSRRLVDDYFALLAAFIAGVSSWLLIFSRLGDVQIIVPLLATCALWLVARITQRGHNADIVACAVVSTLGLYAHAQSFILPAAIGLTLLCLRWASHAISWGVLVRFALVVVLCSLPFAWIVARNPVNFFSGYIGGKLEASQNPFSALITNIANDLLALHMHGDINARSNPAELPHLDQVSGILFLLGIVFWLRPARRRWSPLLLVPLISLQLPSLLVLGRPNEVPSASRTLGSAPIVYILVASGLWWMIQALNQYRRSRPLTYACTGALLAAIVLLNAQRYFQTYLSDLPYQNTPIGRIATTYLDSLPPETQIYLVECCWEGGMPEPLGIQHSMIHPENLHTTSSSQLDCQQLQSFAQPAVLLWSFHNLLPAPQLVACQQWLPAQLHTSARGLPAFYAATLHLEQAASTGSIQLATPVAQPTDNLVSARAQLSGDAAEVRFSPLDMGQVADLFDGNHDTLIRGKDANPFVLELHFAHPRAISLVVLDLGTIPQFSIDLSITHSDGATQHVLQNYKDLPPDPHLELSTQGEVEQVTNLRIEILDHLPAANGAHIHVRELLVR